MDYSFNHVNQFSLPLALTHAMQFGAAFHRLVQRIVYANPAYGPPLLLKVDLADGYYRIPLSPEAALELAVVLPSDGTPAPLVGIPLSLPMGWGLSPPYFCAFTETGADIANWHLTAPQPLPPHPLEDIAQTSPVPSDHEFAQSAAFPYQLCPSSQPLAYVDVYIDDFIGVAQRPCATHLRRCLFHTIDSIFHDAPTTARRATISESKLQKGDAAWSYNKRILGWDLDTQHMMMHLPPHRATRLRDLITGFLSLRRTSRRKWQRFLGELRSMVAALHSTKYLFSILQHVLVDQRGHRLRINQLVRQSLHDWLAIANSLALQPVSLISLVPTAPTLLGATDASQAGMGGFWAPTNLHFTSQPIVWRAPFPPSLQRAVVSTSNPTGSITNSDLELAAIVTGASVTVPHPTATPAVLLCATDNTLALAWSTKGSTSSNTTPAFLLPSLAQQACHRNFLLNTVYTPGLSNTLADFCSRSFHLSNDDFLRMVQHRFPSQPWKLVHPNSDLLLHMTSSLSKRMQPWASPLDEPPPLTPPGTSGRTFVPPSNRMHTSAVTWTPSHSSAYSLGATGLEPLLPTVLQSALAQWRAPFVPLARRWPHWDALIPASRSPAG
jgi:hypothetical protein